MWISFPSLCQLFDMFTMWTSKFIYAFIWQLLTELSSMPCSGHRMSQGQSHCSHGPHSLWWGTDKSKPINTWECIRWLCVWQKVGQGDTALDGTLELRVCSWSCQELTVGPGAGTITVNIGWELTGAKLYTVHFADTTHWYRRLSKMRELDFIIFEVSFSSDICAFIQQHLIVMLHFR